MSFLSTFDDDIIISYAHLDDQPLKGHDGWITNLHHDLETRVSQLLGYKVAVWRDPKLTGNDEYTDELVDQMAGKGVLVSVLSPRYLTSDWCLREVREFCLAAERTGGVRVNNKFRIFKVVKTPVPRDQYPPPLRDLLEYRFYRIEESTDRPHEFNPEIDPEALKDYWARVEDLATDIKELLKTLKGLATGSNGKSGPTIYLAETTYDLNDKRDSIKRELQQRGCNVLPDRPLPLRASDLDVAVREYLGQSGLAIHLIGEKYGIIPEAADCSITCLQARIAQELANKYSFSRIIWMPSGLTAKEDRQREFIETLRNDSTVENAPDVLESSVDELKTLIKTRLDDIAKHETDQETPKLDDSSLTIYVVCDPRDLNDLAPLEDHLFNLNFEVITPAMEGDESQVREDHLENLRTCDAVIIYYGAAQEPWFRTKLRDLRKLPGYGRSRPMLAQAIYISGPTTTAKEHFRTHEPMVIKNLDSFAPHLLDPFVKEIEKGKKGKANDATRAAR